MVHVRCAMLHRRDLRARRPARHEWREDEGARDGDRRADPWLPGGSDHVRARSRQSV